jgi:hypothetical protein
MPLKVQPAALFAGLAGEVPCARTIGADNNSTAPANVASHDEEVIVATPWFKVRRSDVTTLVEWLY